MIFRRKKKLPDQDPISTRLGEFRFDPGHEEWRCMPDDETEYKLSISYSTKTDGFGIIIDLDGDLNPTGHMWYD
jgi:hypothetical protein